MVRVSELASRAGVPLSAVKYYQREGLLPPGERSAPNQVRYDDAHVQRVRLIRALLETGGLSIAATKDVIATLDAPEAPLAETFHAAQQAMSTPRTATSAPSEESSMRVSALVAVQRWRARPDNPGLDVAARALDGLRAVGVDVPDAYLDAYAQAAVTAAAADLQVLADLPDPETIAKVMVVGTVLGDPLFAGLRRLAQEHVTAEVFPAGPGPV